MTETSCSHNIVVRKIPFDFDEKIDPIWNPDQPEWSHMVSGASLTMPYLEPFLIRTVREAMAQIEDPGLKDDVRGFMAQEGQHFQNHRRFNDLLKDNGYSELAAIEDKMEADYKRLQKKSLKWRVAYTAGFETMTMGLTEWMIKDRRKLFAGADPSVTSLILWHMVEETEHKTVACDLYHALFNDYPARVWGVFCGSWHVMQMSRKAYITMLKKDGRWYNWRSRWTTQKRGAAFLWNVGKMLVQSMMPGHHPSRVSDPEWVTEWADAYANLPEDHIPLLDTSDPDIPAQFA
jgi:predicted metal-dependent hydrolase